MNDPYLWLWIEVVICFLILIPTVMALIGAPWVPTPRARAELMVKLADLRAGETIYDLGCGDGRIPRFAAKLHDVKAVGFELSPLVYVWARVRNLFGRSKAKILFRNFYKTNLSAADAIFFYLLPATAKKLKPKFEKELRPGARIISYAFEIEGWEPVFVEPREPKHNYAKIFIYKIPASIKEKGSEAKK